MRIMTVSLHLRMVVLLISCSASLCAFGIDIHTHHLSYGIGFETARVTGMAQDENGYIWFGTLNGLFRYDGYRFKSFNASNKGIVGALSDNLITKISLWHDDLLLIQMRGNYYTFFNTHTNQYEDYSKGEWNKWSFANYRTSPEGILWLWESTKGCMRISYKNGTFSTKIFPAGSHGLPADGIVSIEFLGSDALFIAADGIVYTERDGQFKAVWSPHKGGTPALHIQSTAILGKSLLFFTKTKVWQLDMTSQVLLECKAIQVPNGRASYDNAGNIFVYDDSGMIWWIDKSTSKVIPMKVFTRQLLDFGNNPHYNIISDQRGLIWVSTDGNGLFVYNRKTGELQHFDKPSELHTGVNTNLIHSIASDKSGNIWIFKDNAAPSCITPLPTGVSPFLVTTEVTEERSNEVKMLKAITSDSILVSNNNGKNYLMDSRSNQLKHLPELDGIGLISICRNPTTGDILLGSRHHGVRIEGQWYAHDDDDPASLSSNRINDIIIDKSGRIWMASLFGGLDLAIKQASGRYKFRHFFIDNAQTESGRKLITDHRGNILYGTGDGLYIFNPNQLITTPNAFLHIMLDGDNPRIVEIHDMMIDGDNRLWICTHGQGVFYCHVDSIAEENFHNLTSKEGLVFNATQAITQDGSGNIWVATTNGVSCYQPDKQHFDSYFFSSNTMGNYNSEAAAICQEGDLYFGTLYGIVKVSPKNLVKQSWHPGLKVTDLQVNGESVGATLSYDQNSPTFYFSDFEFSKSRQTQYTYILEGYDREWNTPTNASEATYKNLKPGTYTFRVRSFNQIDNPDDEAMMQIVIRPPLWQTWWAYVLYVIAICLAAYYVYRQLRIIYTLRNRIKIEQQLADYKLKFFTNISHEFRTPLTLIQGAMERIRTIDNMPGEMKQPVSNMNRSVSRLLRLINQLLEFRKMQNDRLALALEETDVIAFIKDIYMNFSEVAANKSISYQFMPFAHSYQMFIDKGFLDKIVYNLLSNAFKYTPSHGSVLVHIKNTVDQLIIEVTDSGVGIPKEKQGMLFTRFMQSSFANDSIGIGLNLSQELVKVHQGTISFAENPEGGSIFTVTLPTDPNVYAKSDFLIPDNVLMKEQTTGVTEWLKGYREMQPVPMNKQTVMIVDDDNDVLQYLQSELIRYFEVITATDGTEAIELLKTELPDLIISDVLMPNMNGHKLTQYLRSHEQFRNIPIILLTAIIGEENQLKGLEKGADVFLTKPFSPQVLIQYCRRLLDKNRSSDQLEGFIPTPAITIDERDHKFMEKMDAWIEMHLSKSITVEDLSAVMGMGRSSLFNKVKELTGQTPIKYIYRKRMNRALEMLHEGGTTISQVSYAVGFDDPHYFTTRFKSWFGITPTDYLNGKNPTKNGD